MITKIRKIASRFYVILPLCLMMLMASCSQEIILSEKIKKINSFSDKEIFLGTLFGVGEVAEFMGVETIQEKLEAIGTNTAAYKLANQEYQLIYDLFNKFINVKGDDYLQKFRIEVLSGDINRVENIMYSTLAEFKEFCKDEIELSIDESKEISSIAQNYNIYDDQGNFDNEQIEGLASELLTNGYLADDNGPDGIMLYGWVGIAVVVVAVAFMVVISIEFWGPIVNNGDDDSRLKLEQLITTITKELSTN